MTQVERIYRDSQLDISLDQSKLMFESIHRQFEQQVEKSPQAIAVHWGDETFTYEALNQRANQIASYLRTIEVQSGELLVGLCVERSFELIAAVFGILKAGGGYLPLDPGYPQDRLALMIDDAKPSVILTQQKQKTVLPTSSVNIACLDEPGFFSALDTENLSGDVGPESLAYVIYTSGSTGRPKGVMIEQGALSSFVGSATQAYGIGSGDRILQFASISFDVAAEEIYPCLLAGGTLVLQTPDMMSSISAFLEICGQRSITILDLPTAFWHVMVAELCATPEMQVPSCIRSIIFGGEAVNAERVRQWQQRFATSGHKIQLINAYGPTETTVDAIIYAIPQQQNSAAEGAYQSIPIGKPLPNVTTYILDEQSNRVELGEEGELFIGGPHLARGYLGRPELTAERFISNPFGEGFLYKTGDWCKVLADGNIEYLGRIDSQVKIRGFRVELGEIESILLEQPEVQEAAVVVNRDASEQQRLIAYIVMSKPGCFDDVSLRAALKEKLPHYMLPSAFVELEALPLTPSDKVDRKTLAARPISLNQAQADIDSEKNKAETQSEEALMGIWENVLTETLGEQKLGIDDSFFEVGGTSLMAMQLFAQIEQIFGQRVQLSALFEAPTIRELALYLDTHKGSDLEEQFKNSVISLKVEGDRPPFFFLNSGVYARQFVPLLSDSQPLYNLNIFNIAERLAKNIDGLSLSEIAEILVADMKTVQPQGPYHIGGFCADSKLAAEMAHQLQAQGEKADLVVMIDPSWDEPAEQNKFLFHIQSLIKFGPQYIIEKFKDVWANFNQAPEEEVKLQAGTAFISDSTQADSLASETNDANQLAQLALQEVSLLRKYESLCDDFHPHEYQGRVAVIFSREAFEEPRDLLVSTLTAGFEEYVVPGLHMTIFENSAYRTQLVKFIEQAMSNVLETRQSDDRLKSKSILPN